MKLNNKRKFIKWTTINALILIIVIVANIVVSQWTLALDLFLGQIGQGETNSETYVSDYDSVDELNDAMFAFSKEVGEESTVLMRNENEALPLAENTEISIFGANVASWAKVGGGSGNVDTSSGDHITLRTTLEDSGLKVNESLYDYYEGLEVEAVSTTKWADVSSAAGKENSDKTALFVVSNQGTEGEDLEEGSLTLTDDQLDMLSEIDNAGYEKIILVLNTANAIEMEFLNNEDIRVDAIVWTGLTGAAGLDGFGPVIAGQANPSGKLVDTYTYNHNTNPVSLNFNMGTEENRYTNSADLESAGAAEDSLQYVNYGESIYLGYKYYETRYADLVTNQNNADNDGYDYDKQIAFPFGHGLSYGQFDYSNMDLSVEDDTINISLDVTNNGTVDGKNVVQIYYQAPYTEYDKENLVEKAAVNLVNFVKTPIIPAGESVSVEMSFPVSDMKSYDAHGEGTYIMDEGDYYIVAAHDAHDAVNSILKEQGESINDNDSQGLVETYSVDDFRILNEDDSTGNEVFNLFNDIEVEQVAEGTYNYLSRQDWSRVDDESIKYTMVAASEELVAAITESGWNAAKRPLDSADLEYERDENTESDLVFADMAGLDYNDPQWEELLDKVSISEMHAMFARAGYTTAEIASIEKPRTTEYDGPAGIKNYVSGWSGFCYPVQITFASTWNVELLEKLGDFIAEEGQRAGTQGWYAPSMNIHRSPYSGRNFEYYSEDGMISGILGAATSKGAEDKGMFVYIKHFVVNDAEQNRNGINTFMTEQALREIYTKPFEIAIKRGGASGLMGSMNRIGPRMTVGSWALMTGLLRDEWGFQGGVVTDFALGYNTETSMQALAAGTNLLLNTTELNLPTTDHNYIRNALRDSTHGVLYMTANSIAVDAGSQGFPVYLILVIVFDVFALLVIAISQFLTIKECFGKGIDEKTSKKYMKIKVGILSLFVIAIAALGIYAYVVWSSRQL